MQAKRLKSIPNGALAAPSHARVRILHRSNGDAYPIFGDRPLPDVPAGPILASEVGGPKCKVWGAVGSDLLAGGASGARLAGPRIGTAPTWPRAGHEVAKCALPSPKIEPFLGGASSARGIKFPSFHAEKRAVLAQGACSTELERRMWMMKVPLTKTRQLLT